MTEKEDPIRLFILSALADGRSQDPQQLARAFGVSRAKPSDPPDAWRRYLVAVRQQALSMARAGLVEFTRKGMVVDPDDVKGVVRVRLPVPGAPVRPKKTHEEDEIADADLVEDEELEDGE